MADDLHKWTAAQVYVALGAGSAGVTVVNEAAYQSVRVAISDTTPDPEHDIYHFLKGRERVTHLELPDGFTVYVRVDAAQGQAHGHYRAYE